MHFYLTLFLIACGSKETPEATETSAPVDLRPTVRTSTIEEQQFVRTLSLPSTIHAKRSAILVPKVQGRIAAVTVDIGDQVSAGDTILTIEKSDYQAGYIEAKAAYELAQIQARQARTSATRFQNLLKEQAVTQSQWEEVDIGAQLAEGQATRARAGFDIAKSRLDETDLKAPFDGIIVERTVEEGEMMGGPATLPPLQIADLSTVVFRANIGESDAAALNTNQSGYLEVPGSTERIDVSINRINQAVDPVVKTVIIEGELDNAQYALKHNQSATLHLEVTQQALAIPRQALLNRQTQSASVFVLTGSTVEQRTVTYGRSETDYVPVFSGLSKGEQILVAGHNRLQDGNEVIVLEE
jgi:RND family efflux transporter MFP subunit